MNDIDPAVVMVAHVNERNGKDWYCAVCDRLDWREPCEPYLLAEALATSEAKVARVDVVLAESHRRGALIPPYKIEAALTDQRAQPS